MRTSTACSRQRCTLARTSCVTCDLSCGSNFRPVGLPFASLTHVLHANVITKTAWCKMLDFIRQHYLVGGLSIIGCPPKIRPTHKFAGIRIGLASNPGPNKQFALLFGPASMAQAEAGEGPTNYPDHDAGTSAQAHIILLRSVSTTQRPCGHPLDVHGEHYANEDRFVRDMIRLSTFGLSYFILARHGGTSCVVASASSSKR
eukprot:430490-Amphidinium_carterae.1